MLSAESLLSRTVLPVCDHVVIEGGLPETSPALRIITATLRTEVRARSIVKKCR
jgi:hypothetical protein